MNRNIDHVDAHGKKIEISSKETENKYYKMKGRYSFSLWIIYFEVPEIVYNEPTLNKNIFGLFHNCSRLFGCGFLHLWSSL